MAYEPGRSDPVGSGDGPLGGGAVEGRDRRQVTRLVVAGVLLLVGLIFVLQNSERVETTFLVFNVTTRLWVGLLCALLLGAILGQVVEAAWQRRRRR
jgi:uncharacterized integral membrane protein